MSFIKLIWSRVCVGVSVFQDPHVNQSLISCVNGFPVTLKMRTNSIFSLIYLFPNEYDLVVVSTCASILMKLAPIVRHSSCMPTNGLVLAVGNAGLRRILKCPGFSEKQCHHHLGSPWIRNGWKVADAPSPSASQVAGSIYHSPQPYWDLSPIPSVEDVTSLSPCCFNYSTIFLPKLIWI